MDERVRKIKRRSQSTGGAGTLFVFFSDYTVVATRVFLVLSAAYGVRVFVRLLGRDNGNYCEAQK